MRNFQMLLVLGLFLFQNQVFGQEKCPFSSRTTRLSFLSTTQKPIRGILETVTDSTISIVFCKKGQFQSRKIYPISKVYQLKSHRTGNALFGSLAGAGCGLVLGGFIGSLLVPASDCKPKVPCYDFSGIAYLFGGAFIGTGVGIVVGGIRGYKSSFTINFEGSKSNSSKKQLQKLRRISTDYND
jgi:hypothetical protein